MVAEIVLKAKKRQKSKENAQKNLMPAVLYGPEVKENKIIWVDKQRFRKIYNEVGESSLIDIEIEGEKIPQEVIIYDVQIDPVSNEYIHADFFKVKKGKKIETDVELEFIGESPAVKESGAILVKNINHLEVRCLPKDLPRKIEVDISTLKKIDEVIYIKDLSLPEGVESSWDIKTVVVMTEAPRTEEELKELDEKVETDMDKVGDVEEGKEEEEEKEEGEEKDKKDTEEKKGEEKEESQK